MKVLVTGGRDYKGVATVFQVLDYIHRRIPITLLIQGGATGADAHALEWAKTRGVPWVQDDADWTLYRGHAGRVRNCKMLRRGPDLVVAFPGGKGTRHMKQIAREAQVRVFEVKR